MSTETATPELGQQLVEAAGKFREDLLYTAPEFYGERWGQFRERLREIADGRAAEDAKLRRSCQHLGHLVTGMARSMEAARIEMIQNGPEAAMQWILNSIPDVSDEAPEDQWDGKETATQWIDRMQAADRAYEAENR